MRDFLIAPPSWLSGGEDRDAVVSVRARYARSLDGYAFPWRSSRDEQLSARERVLAALAASLPVPDLRVLALEDCDAVELAALRERGLCGSDADSAGRASAVAGGGAESFQVNGIDHLRLAAWAPGSDAEGAFKRLRDREKDLDLRLGFAASRDYGYLCARPEDCGSGLRLSALAFLPGIAAADVFDRVFRGLLSSGVEPRLRPLDGDGPSEGAQPFVELSARAPLGTEEEEFVERFKAVLKGVVDGERLTRERVLQRERTRIEDRTLRAAAVLQAARRLGADETPRLLSRLREGLVYGTVPFSGAGDPYAPADAARLLGSPSHLRLAARTRRDGRSDDADEARSSLVRALLPRYHI